VVEWGQDGKAARILREDIVESKRLELLPTLRAPSWTAAETLS
jgi:hypothetical protein